MKVDYDKMEGAETPASLMRNYVLEHVSALMIMGGIETISFKKYEIGGGSRIHTSVSFFKGAPDEIVTQGVVLKDALAQILSVANISRAVLRLSEEDLQGMRNFWNGPAPSEAPKEPEQELKKA
jgi:hypothetical protein